MSDAPRAQQELDTVPLEAWARVALPDANLIAPLNGGQLAAAPVLQPPITTDAGFADLFESRHGKKVSFCHELDIFFVWDGALWRPDNAGAVLNMALEMGRDRLREAAAQAALGEVGRAVKEAVRLCDVDSAASMLEALKVRPGVIRSISDFDADPMLMGVANGVLDLRERKLCDPDPALLVSKRAGCAFDADAKAPRWIRFLEEILPDTDVRAYVRRQAGLILTGLAAQWFLFLYGLGANGKTTLVEALFTLLGEYATRATGDLLVRSRQFKNLDFELARLPGVRLLVGSEWSEGTALNENLVKDLTGGDSLRARDLYKSYFTFRPQLKLWMLGNHKPGIAGSDQGIWRRVRLVHFGQTIPKDKQDPKLPEALREELPGILNWCLDGLADYLGRGDLLPDAVQAATAEYRDAEDLLAQFAEDVLVLTPGATITKSDVYEQYRYWASNNGIQHLWTQKTLAKRLVERFGLEERRTRAARLLAGARLRESGDA
mgnify:CR=1 FL=1